MSSPRATQYCDVNEWKQPLNSDNNLTGQQVIPAGQEKVHSETNDSEALSVSEDSLSITLSLEEEAVTNINNEFPFQERYESVNDTENLLPLQEQLEYLTFDEGFEIDPKNLTIGEHLGGGFFGDVCKGVLKMNGSELTVAVKKPKSASDERMRRMNEIEREEENSRHRESLRDELKIMSSHSNIIQLLGAITKSKENFCIVLEYCEYGGLDSFLRQKFENNLFVDELARHNDSERSSLISHLTEQDTNMEKLMKDYSTLRKNGFITTSDLLWFSLQITGAMAFLAENLVLHRDVALRNILLKSNFSVRLSDFGLYRKGSVDGSYIQRRNIIIPFRYIAPEVLRSGRFSKQSELWSFGVVLWELFTFAEQQPYSNNDHLNARDVPDILDFLDSGGRLPIPEQSPKPVTSMMTMLWNEDPKLRPAFKYCRDVLHKELLRLNPKATLLFKFDELCPITSALSQQNINTLQNNSEERAKHSEAQMSRNDRKGKYIICASVFLLLILIGLSAFFVFRLFLHAPETSDANVSCRSGWIISPKKDKCFKLFQQAMNWDSANGFCRNRGGNLASLKSREEKETLNDFMHWTHSTVSRVFIGGRSATFSEGNNTVWQWVDVTSVANFDTWANESYSQLIDQKNRDHFVCEPIAEGCMIMLPALHSKPFGKECCEIKRPFVCEISSSSNTTGEGTDKINIYSDLSPTHVDFFYAFPDRKKFFSFGSSNFVIIPTHITNQVCYFDLLTDDNYCIYNEIFQRGSVSAKLLDVAIIRKENEKLFLLALRYSKNTNKITLVSHAIKFNIDSEKSSKSKKELSFGDRHEHFIHIDKNISSFSKKIYQDTATFQYYCILTHYLKNISLTEFFVVKIDVSSL